MNEFIQKVTVMYSTNPKVKEKIASLEDLIEGLIELDKMEGLEIFKSEVIAKIKSHLVADETSEKIRHHTVISGAPGCGKTTLAKVVAKIYVALGLVKKPNNKSISASLTEEGVSSSGSKILAKLTIGLVIFSFLALFVSYKILLILFVIFLVLIAILTFFESKVDSDQFTNSKENFAVLKRSDLVGLYVGHTAHIAESAFRKCLGKVVFIDEAYSLVSGSFDQFGRELLNAMLVFMDKHQDEIIFIFGGYKQDIVRNIFNEQKGLERRFPWTFNIDTYSMRQLFSIFKIQLQKHGMRLSKSIVNDNVIQIFENNAALFPYSGGDTENLVTYLKQYYHSTSFDRMALAKDEINEEDDGVTFEMIIKSVKTLARSKNIPFKYEKVTIKNSDGEEFVENQVPTPPEESKKSNFYEDSLRDLLYRF